MGFRLFLFILTNLFATYSAYAFVDGKLTFDREPNFDPLVFSCPACENELLESFSHSALDIMKKMKKDVPVETARQILDFEKSHFINFNDSVKSDKIRCGRVSGPDKAAKTYDGFYIPVNTQILTDSKIMEVIIEGENTTMFIKRVYIDGLPAIVIFKTNKGVLEDFAFFRDTEIGFERLSNVDPKANPAQKTEFSASGTGKFSTAVVGYDLYLQSREVPNDDSLHFVLTGEKKTSRELAEISARQSTSINGVMEWTTSVNTNYDNQLTEGNIRNSGTVHVSKFIQLRGSDSANFTIVKGKDGTRGAEIDGRRTSGYGVTLVDGQGTTIKHDTSITREDSTTRAKRITNELNTKRFNFGYVLATAYDEEGTLTDKREKYKGSFDPTDDVNLTWSKELNRSFEFGTTTEIDQYGLRTKEVSGNIVRKEVRDSEGETTATGTQVKATLKPNENIGFRTTVIESEDLNNGSSSKSRMIGVDLKDDKKSLTVEVANSENETSNGTTTTDRFTFRAKPNEELSLNGSHTVTRSPSSKRVMNTFGVRFDDPEALNYALNLNHSTVKMDDSNPYAMPGDDELSYGGSLKVSDADESITLAYSKSSHSEKIRGEYEKRFQDTTVLGTSDRPQNASVRVWVETEETERARNSAGGFRYVILSSPTVRSY